MDAATVIIVDKGVQEVNLSVLLLVEDVYRVGKLLELLVKLVGVFVQGGQGLVVGARGGRE